MINRIDDRQPHAFWDNKLPPRAVISSGDVVVFDTLEGTGQIDPATTSNRLVDLRSDLVHPLTGPIYIEEAESGDTLEIEIVSFDHKSWGWSAVFPGGGLLGSDFDTPYIHHYTITDSECIFRDDIRIPLDPFCGVMGVAPAELGRFDTYSPRRNGGNIDIRHLTARARAFLPVLVDGALFSCGDCHAAQGDGEVNGTGVEAPMSVELRFHVHKNKSVPELEFYTAPDSPLSRSDSAGYFVTTAHGPDLFLNAQTATRYMIDHLVKEYGMRREQAYCLCGAAVDLRISEIVDDSVWIVSAYLPLSIFKN
jgi:acetamidase/formamidase